nr:SLC13 family permease [Pseudomonas sp.]
LSRRLQLPPGQVLMPLAFGTILGGMTTLIGTPPNIIVSGFRADASGSGFDMFDFSPVGVAVAATGVAFIALLGWRLVPARKQSGVDTFDTAAYLTEVRVPDTSKVVGLTLGQIEADEADLQIVGLVRSNLRLTAPDPRRAVQAGDILVLEMEAGAMPELLSRLDLRLEEARENGSRPHEDHSDMGENPLLEQQKAGDARTADEIAGTQPLEYTLGNPARAEHPSCRSAGTSVPLDALPRSAALAAEEGKEEETRQMPAETDEIALIELAVLPGSSLVAHSAAEIQLRKRYGINMLAVSRQGSSSMTRLRALRIRAGDLLLMQGTPEAVAHFAGDAGCVPLAERPLRIPDGRLALKATAIMVISIVVAAFGWLPASVAFAGGVLASMAMQTVSLRAVYQTVDWTVIVLLAALIPVAGALESTGTADLIARFLMEHVAHGHAIAALAVIMLVTMTLSDVMNNAATAAVMCPIAIGTASQLQVSADPFLMAVAIGASCAFLTPIGHQNNTLILGPGGFRFGDYWRLGLPLELIVLAVGMPLLLLAWPL